MEKQNEENGVARTNKITKDNNKDGSWGWVIIAAAFMAHVLADECYSLWEYYI